MLNDYDFSIIISEIAIRTMNDLLIMQGITKVFSGNMANDQIDFSLKRGEIHGILGENGAGKTTLMNILSGIYQPQKGVIYYKGVRTKIGSPQQALKAGIVMVHQNPMLIPAMTVRENLMLASGFKGIIRKKSKIEQDIKAIMKRYRLSLDLDAKISALSVGQFQRVELLKALQREPELLIFDESTSALTDKETEEFFEILRTLKTAGCSIILISHKIHEMMSITDRITVLRHGRVAGLFRTDEVDKERLAAVMMGARPSSQMDSPDCDESLIDSWQGRLPALELKGISTSIYSGGCDLVDINLAVYPGEILGIAGVDGNGQRELAEVIAGISRACQGSIIIQGKQVRRPQPRKMIDGGVALIPQDRYESGAIGEFSLEENLILPIHNKSPFSWLGFLQREAISSFAKHSLEEFGIKAPHGNFKARALSGGNLQRLILARELSRNPAIIVACYPTRGLDLSARDYVWFKLKQEKDKGKAIVLISADLEEILFLSDRVGILYEGRLIGPLPVEEVSREKLGLYMSGG